MYATGNLEKFLADNTEAIGDRADEIREQARLFTSEGWFPGGSLEDILGDPELVELFKQQAQSPEHLEIAVQTIRPSPR